METRLEIVREFRHDFPFSKVSLSSWKYGIMEHPQNEKVL